MVNLVWGGYESHKDKDTSIEVCMCEDDFPCSFWRPIYSLKSHLPKSSSDHLIKLSCSSRSPVNVMGAWMLPAHRDSLELKLTPITCPRKCTWCHLKCFRVQHMGLADRMQDHQKPHLQWQPKTWRDTPQRLAMHLNLAFSTLAAIHHRDSEPLVCC